MVTRALCSEVELWNKSVTVAACVICSAHPPPLPSPPLQLNAVYLPQLQGALATPQSVGIVGGLPRSSLYFIGVQGENVLYLDPHQVQEAACSDGDCDSFRCDVLRTLPLPSIDPSLALGFYCGSAGAGWGCRRSSEECSGSHDIAFFCSLNAPAKTCMCVFPAQRL